MKPVRWDKHSNLVMIDTAGDGSCSLHSIVQAFHPGYQSGRYEDGTPFDRYSFVRGIRDELATNLSVPVNGTEGPTWYESLSRGTLEEYAKATKGILGSETPDLSKKGFEKHLRSSAWLGHEIMEYCSRLFGIGIFILHEDNRGQVSGLYHMGKENDLYYQGFTKAVLILNHDNKHFSTCARKEHDGGLRTLFNMEDPMISDFLRELS